MIENTSLKIKTYMISPVLSIRNDLNVIVIKLVILIFTLTNHGLNMDSKFKCMLSFKAAKIRS